MHCKVTARIALIQTESARIFFITLFYSISLVFTAKCLVTVPQSEILAQFYRILIGREVSIDLKRDASYFSCKAKFKDKSIFV